MSVPLDRPGPSADSGGTPAPEAAKSLLPFDILRVILHTVRGWKWMTLAALVGGGGAAALGAFTLTTKYTSQVQLVRQEVQNNFQASEIGESFRPRQFNAATVSAMMRAGPLMEKTGAALKPPLSPMLLQEGIVIRPEKNTDLITIAWTEKISAAHAVETINLYAANVVALTKDLQANEARELLGFITSQVERTETELAAVQRDMMAFSRESGLYNADKETESYLKQIGELELKIETSRIERETVDYRMTQSERELARQNPGVQRLKEARERLAELLTQFTAEHPTVVDQQARVNALEKSALPDKTDATAAFQSSGNTVANNLYLDILTLRSQKESLINQIRSLQIYRDQVKAKLDSIPDKSLVQARIRGRATSLEETRDLLAGRQREAQLFAESAPGYYRLFAPATPDGVEVSSRSIKLAILAFAGALLGAGLVAAFRALRAAMDDRIVSPSDVRRLTKTPIIASLPAEDVFDTAALARWRFATWANFVRAVPAPPHAALVAGLLSASDGEGKSTWLRHLGRAALDRGMKVLAISHGQPTTPGDEPVHLLTGLEDPESILTHLRSSQPPAVELNAPADWRWNAAKRQQWRDALAVWNREPSLVILVELPPASELDSLLLAETLPAILWLSDSGTLRREQVTGILDTIRQSGVNLIGSLLNRIPPIFQKLPDLAKFGLCLTALAAALSTSAAAQPTDRDPAPEPSPINANANGDLPAISLTPPSLPALPDSVPTSPGAP
ncbi:MAG: Protein involved in polysaccharide export, contains domain of the beta-grasp fold, partial [Verrucomicrobiales bacterium]|nr:Protein involved in polysaccharide export, contains domain of the beta-grasp fold [Verrucomicrobiales bacterium]